MSVVVRNPKPDELTTVWEVLCGAFGEGPRERFRRQIWEDSTFAIEQIRIAEVDGKIVSHVWVAERPVFYRGQAVLPMGGIGGVGTLPDYRGQGLATLLLEDAIAYMERKEHAISMLFTDINPFYARLGWANFPEWRFQLEVQRLPDKSQVPEGYFVRPCEIDKDLPDLQAIYRKHVEKLQLSLCHARPNNFWFDGHPQYLGLKPSHVVVKGQGTRDEGKAVGYVCASATERGIRLSEFAYDPEHPQGLIALAVALASEAKAEGKEGVIEGITPFAHPLPQILAELTDANLWHQVSEHMMLRVNNLLQCLEIAQTLMEKTLTEVGAKNLHGSFRFSLSKPEQSAVIEVQSGKVKVRDNDAAEVTIPVTPREFCLLFFGAVSVWQWRHLLVRKGVVLNETQTALLSLLFPNHPTAYWGGDHF
ncbi:MAG: GNAT family N-acetyltransferase [Armatimonadota bacterium]|nr:GNAT family N-acetyltransferase [Armatimonadota bacterium]MDW8144422.1 GNAT family N-acetyltransferase [Armatimonadota bacterium]